MCQISWNVDGFKIKIQKRTSRVESGVIMSQSIYKAVMRSNIDNGSMV